MKEPLDKNKLGKGRVIPEVTYSVVENLGWDSKDKKQRKIGEITQLQFIDLQSETELKLIDEKTGELLLECAVGDKYHQLLLETGLNTILEKFVSGNDWESKMDKEWTPIDTESKKFDVV